LAFLEAEGYSKLSTEGIERFLKSLEQERPDGRSPERIIRYSASSFNQHLKAVKTAVRYALDHSPEIGNGKAYQIEKYLRSLKLKKTTPGIAKAERVPTSEEIEVLVEQADPRLRCMIEFLKETSCRISEMLQAEAGKVRCGARITRIAILGKGGRQRDLKCQTTLFDRIKKTFRGKVYLFEHDGRQYSRISVTNRIRDLA
jgi:site-specific recombinase XerD